MLWVTHFLNSCCFFPSLQAAIGSVALDTARGVEDKTLEQYGMDILTAAFLAILITAPTGALIIGFTGPRLLSKTDIGNEERLEMRTESQENFIEQPKDPPNWYSLQSNTQNGP